MRIYPLAVKFFIKILNWLKKSKTVLSYGKAHLPLLNWIQIDIPGNTLLDTLPEEKRITCGLHKAATLEALA